MTRLTHLLTALSLTGLFIGVTIAACGGHPASPGEMPRVAPRPDPVDPSARPLPGAADPTSPTRPTRPISGMTDGGVVLSPGAVSRAMVVPSPVFLPVTAADGGAAADAGAPPDAGVAPDAGTVTDAGVADARGPRLPPIPDGNLPADSRMEPILSRD